MGVSINMKTDSSAIFKQSTLFHWIELRVANSCRVRYGSHSHDEFSFGLITQGRAKYCNGNSVHQIGRGDIVTINPTDVHSCNPCIGTWSYSMLFADIEQMGLIQQEITQNASFDYLPFKHQRERDPLLNKTFLDLLYAIQHESNILQAQVAIYDFIEACLNLQLYRVKKSSKVHPNLHRIRDKLFDEIGIIHSLEDLANEVGMSRYQVLRAFKKQYGLSPHAYLMDERIKRAKNMLKSGQALSDVALQLGFSDQAHFQRQFKKTLAVTPKFYQSHFMPNRSKSLCG